MNFMIRWLYRLKGARKMNPSIAERLSQISDEEMSVLSKNYNINDDTDPAFANMKLKRRDYLWNVIGTNQMVTARIHTRFVDIPMHSHSYIEMMYVFSGSVTHFIEGKSVTLESGELLLMNRHIKHSVSASSAGDIGVNFIISPDFLPSITGRIQNSSSLSEFVAEDMLSSGESKYLRFKTSGDLLLENIIENLIYSAICDKNVPQIVLTDTLHLLFRYLSMYPDKLIGQTEADSRGSSVKRKITDYIQTNYRKPGLVELSELLGFTPQYVSRLIKDIFGATFNELVREKRFSEAEHLLLTTDLPVVDIAGSVGYENNSFFHKKFYEQYGTTPYKWRNANRQK